MTKILLAFFLIGYFLYPFARLWYADRDIGFEDLFLNGVGTRAILGAILASIVWLLIS